MVKKESFLEFLSISFLFCLGVLAFGQIFSTPIFGFDLQSYELGAKILTNISAIQYGIVVFAIVCGSLLFYANKDKIESIEEEQDKELEEEEKRKSEFGEKFPRINKIPGVKSVVKWMYGEGWGYSLGLFGIIIFSLFLRFYNLGELGFYGDEFFHQLSADGIKETGLPTLPNGLLYVRGIITSYLSYFGIIFFDGEFGYRVFQALFGFLLMIYSFFLVKPNFGKNIALLYLFVVGTELWILEFSRYLRFYNIQIFLTIIILLLLIQKDSFKSIFKISLLFIFVLISFLESQSAFFLLPIIFIIILYNHIKNIKQNILKILSLWILFLIPLIIIFGINFSGKALNSMPNSEIENEVKIGFLEKVKNAVIKNIDYDENLFFIKSLFLAYPILFIFCIISIIILIFENDKKRKIILIGSLLFLLFILTILKSKEQQRILSFLLPLFILISAFSLYKFNQTKKIIFLFSIFLIIIIDLLPSLKTPFRNYGDKFHSIKNLSSAVPIYPDYLSTSNFINKNSNNIVVVVNGPGANTIYGYLENKNFKYIQPYHQNITSDGKDLYTNNKIISHFEYISGDFIFLTSYESFGIKIPFLNNKQEHILQRLSNNNISWVNNNCKIIYHGKDNYSKVFLCNKNGTNK